MRKWVIAATALCCLSSGAMAKDQVTDMVKFARDGVAGFPEIITGVGRGVEGANLMLEWKKMKTLYCQPKIAITGDQYLRIIEGYIEDNPSKGAFPAPMVGEVMVMALQAAFPCQGAN